MFSRDNKPGQIVYLSSAFVDQKQNREAIKKKGYGIIEYNDHPYNIDKVDETDANGGYN
ncbi:hypothetical protein FACS1894218_3280 [Bacilli bacterium]|nr:hypothetical protein FACS1894218_3280 [Bacilli bacterium]